MGNMLYNNSGMNSSKIATGSLVLIVIFISGVVLKLARPVLFPFFLAIFLSFVLSPVLKFFTRLKIPKAISILFILIFSYQRDYTDYTDFSSIIFIFEYFSFNREAAIPSSKEMTSLFSFKIGVVPSPHEGDLDLSTIISRSGC